jgi:hypothetical protein
VKNKDKRLGKFNITKIKEVASEKDYKSVI